MKLKERQLSIGACISYIAIGINIIAGLFFTPLLIDAIGENQYALYTLSTSFISLFLVDFGLSSATSSYISKFRANNEEEKIGDFLGVIYKLYFFITIIIAIVFLCLFLFIDKIFIQLSPADIDQLRVVLLITGIFSILTFPCITFNGILNSYEKFIFLKLSDIIYKISFVALTLIAILLGKGLYCIVSIHAFVGIIIVLYKYIVIKKYIPVKVNFKYKSKDLYKSIFKFSFWITISSLAQRMIFNIMPTILGVVASSLAIAVFGIITTIESYSYTITTAINGMFMPKISNLLINNEKEVNSLFQRVGKFQFVVGSLIFVGFLLVGKEFIIWWVGDSFIDAYYGVLLVIFPNLFYNSLQIANTTMILKNKIYIPAVIKVATGLLNVGLSFWFAKIFGVIGACVSIFFAYTVRFIALHIIYSKTKIFNIKTLILNTYLRCGIVIIATTILCFIIKKLINITTIYSILIFSIIIICIFVLMILLIGLNKIERRTLLTKIFVRKK